MAAHRSKRRRFAPYVALVAGTLSWMLAGVQVAHAAGPLRINSTNLPVNAYIDVFVDATLCTNTSSVVTVSGSATIATLGMDLRFRNQVQDNNGTKTKTIEGFLNLSLDSQADQDGDPDTTNTYPYYPSGISTGYGPDGTEGYGGYWDYLNGESGELGWFMPKQPSQGGVGGNPWISFDADGVRSAAVDATIIGRCVQGNRWRVHGGPFQLENFADGLVGAAYCGNDRSDMTYDASAGTGENGIDSMIMFDNNKNKVVKSDEAAAKWTFETLPGGDKRFAKGVGQGGAGGNPKVDARFYVFKWTDLNSDGDIDNLPDTTPKTSGDEYYRMSPVTKNAGQTGGEGNGPWSETDRCKNLYQV